MKTAFFSFFLVPYLLRHADRGARALAADV